MHGTQTNPEEAMPPRTDYFAHGVVGANGSLVDRVHRNKIRITAFGRLYRDEEVDWSFRPFKQPGDGGKDLPSARLLPLVAESMGTREWLAPTPKFERNIVRRRDLRTPIRFERGGKTLTLLRGAEADICVLDPGETFAITAGGCAVGWMYHPAKARVVVAHMGLECVLDKEVVFRDGTRKLQTHESVIERMIKLFALAPGELKDLRAGYDFPIDPLHYLHQWDHPTDAEQNKKLCEYIASNFGEHCIVNWENEKERRLGRIELGLIIRAQYLKLRIPKENIHSSSAPDTVDLKGQPVWYDTRGPFDPNARNLILVTALP